MQRTRFLLLLLVCCCCYTLRAQQVFYSTYSTTRLYTAQEWQEQESANAFRFPKRKDQEIIEKIDTLQKPDTTIYLIQKIAVYKPKERINQEIPPILYEKVAASLQAPPPPPSPLYVWNLQHTPFPAFELESENGEQVSNATLQGKPSLLVFWNSGCTECNNVLDVIEKVRKQFRYQVHFYAFTAESREQLEPSLLIHPVSMPILIDSQSFLASFGSYHFPKFFFLDENGIIRHIWENIDYVYDDEARTAVPGKGQEIIKELNTLLKQ